MSDDVFAGATAGDRCRLSDGQCGTILRVAPPGSRMVRAVVRVPLDRYGRTGDYGYLSNGRINLGRSWTQWPTVLGPFVTTDDDVKDYYA